MSIDTEIREHVSAALSTGEYSAVIAVAPDNVQYLSGVQLPFQPYNPDRFVLVFWPKDGAPVCVAHAEWASTVARGRIEKVIAYSGDTPSAVETVAAAVAELAKSSLAGQSAIGIDAARTPSHLYAALRRALPGTTLADASGWFEALRRVKTPAEIALLEETAYRTDHAITGASHHIMAHSSRPEKGACEIIRVHCLEREMDFLGYDGISEVGSGEHARKFWAVAPYYGVGLGKSLKKGEFVRMTMTASMDGYRSDACRLLVMGEPTAAQAEAYSHLVALRELAVRTMKPGVACNEVYGTVCEAARAQNLPLVADMGIGHSVGVSPEESPYLNASDTTPLQEGMVMVLDLIVVGPDQELLRSKDTVILRESGAEVAGWYKDWREPYLASLSWGAGGG